MKSASLPAAISLCADLSPEMRALALRGSLHSYPKKAVIILEGDSGDSLFVLLKGSAKVFSMSEDGREYTFGHVHPGDYFGEMSLDGGSRSASVITLESCTCSVVSRAAVNEHLAHTPGFAISLVDHVIRRARAAMEAARSLALLDVYGRLIAVLEKREGVRVRDGDAGITLEPITHQDIANLVGASREMVSRLLKDLEKGHYIALGSKRITVLKKLPGRW
jgi:CRP/FNR family transcriptional regulator, cyclic AMP receptor protein